MLASETCFQGEITKLCSVPQSEGTGSSNGIGKLRQQAENGSVILYGRPWSLWLPASLSTKLLIMDHLFSQLMFPSGFRTFHTPTSTESQHRVGRIPALVAAGDIVFLAT